MAEEIITSTNVETATDHEYNASEIQVLKGLEADINGKLWTSLFLSNKDKLLEEIDRFSASLQTLREAIAAENEEEITAFLEEAGRRRREMMHRGNS